MSHPTMAEGSQPISLTRLDLCLAVILATGLLLLGFRQMIPGVCGVFHDDGVYASTAKALATGEGYRLINLPGSPPQTKYPILYPALLACIWKLWPAFPDNLIAMQGLSLASNAVFLALAYLFMVGYGYGARLTAFAACALSGSSVLFLYFSILPLSEAPFALISVVVLWAVERQMRLPASRRLHLFLLGILVGLPFLFRAVGLVILPVSLFFLSLAGKPVRHVLTGSALTTMPWIAWVLFNTSWSTESSNLYYTNYVGWWHTFGWSLVRQACSNFLLIAAQSLEMGISFLNFTKNPLNPSFVLIPLFFGIVTLLLIFFQIPSRRLLPGYLAGYFLVIALWPWPPFRFLVPVLPFLLVYAVEIFHRLFLLIPARAIMRGAGVPLSDPGRDRLPQDGPDAVQMPVAMARRFWMTAAFLAILIAGNIVSVSNTARMYHETGYPGPQPYQKYFSWSSFEDLFLWIRRHTKPTDILASAFDPMIYLYTDRQAVRSFVMHPGPLFYGEEGRPFTAEEMESLLEYYHVSYLIHTPLAGAPEEAPYLHVLQELRQKHPELLKPVYVGRDDRFQIFQRQPVSSPTR